MLSVSTDYSRVYDANLALWSRVGAKSRCPARHALLRLGWVALVSSAVPELASGPGDLGGHKASCCCEPVQQHNKIQLMRSEVPECCRTCTQHAEQRPMRSDITVPSLSNVSGTNY